MRNTLASAVAAVLAAATALGGEKIHMEARSDVFFSNPSTPDVATAVLKGDACTDAVLKLTLRAGGREIFSREIPMKVLVSCDVLSLQPEQQRWAPSFLMNHAFTCVSAADRSCKPESPGSIGCWASPRLSDFREANAPLLCFWTNTEDSTCIAYDAETKRVVEVWRHTE